MSLLPRNPDLRVLGRRSPSSPKHKDPHPSRTPLNPIQSKPRDLRKASQTPFLTQISG
uniref:Uncharacterized protein n=1 Tax=Cucumis melo TaxID=3656 RepID=A0A9I9DJR3_CUCME